MWSTHVVFNAGSNSLNVQLDAIKVTFITNRFEMERQNFDSIMFNELKDLDIVL